MSTPPQSLLHFSMILICVLLWSSETSHWLGIEETLEVKNRQAPKMFQEGTSVIKAFCQTLQPLCLRCKTGSAFVKSKCVTIPQDNERSCFPLLSLLQVFAVGYFLKGTRHVKNQSSKHQITAAFWFQNNNFNLNIHVFKQKSRGKHF